MLTNIFRSASLAFLIAATTVLSSPVRTRSPYVVKDTHNVPNKWHKVGPAPPNHIINLHIGLRQSQFDELERQLYEGRQIAGQYKLYHIGLKPPFGVYG